MIPISQILTEGGRNENRKLKQTNPKSYFTFNALTTEIKKSPDIQADTHTCIHTYKAISYWLKLK